MGSTYCNKLKELSPDLSYAFSMKPSWVSDEPTNTQNFFGIHFPSGIKLEKPEQNSLRTRSVFYDTGASSTAIDVSFIKKLLNRTLPNNNHVQFNDESTWAWLESQKLPRINCSSFVLDAFAKLQEKTIQSVKSKPPKKMSVQGFILPLLFSFPHKEKFVLPIRASILNTGTEMILLSPKDVKSSFTVLIDPGDHFSNNRELKYRFFETNPSGLKNKLHCDGIERVLEDIKKEEASRRKKGEA